MAKNMTAWNYWKKWYALLLTAIVIVLLGLLIERVGFIKDIESRTLDYRFKTFTRAEEADEDVVMLVIDDSSLEFFMSVGLSWPWPRDTYANILNYFDSVGAKAVLFDLLFYESDIDRFDVDAEVTDGSFARAMKQYGGAVLSAQAMYEKIEEYPALSGLSIKDELIDKNLVKEFPGMRAPISDFLKTTKALGLINVFPDADGIVRRVPMLYKVGSNYFLQFALAGLFASGELEQIQIKDQELYLNGKLVPTDKNGDYLVNWYGKDGPKGSFKYYPFSAAMQSAMALRTGREPLLAEDTFKDKYIIIGATAPGLRDLVPTPISQTHPGAELWATVLSNYLNRDYVRFMPQGIKILYYLLLSFLLMLCFTKNPLRLGNLIVILLFLAVFALPLFLWGVYRIEAKMLSPLLIALISFMYITTVSYLSEGRSKREIKRAFSRYLHPEIIEHLIENPALVDFKGYEYDATVFFTDIYDFTTFSEKNSPQELIKLLNEYFDNLTGIILDNEGMLDKFMGDGLMAVFGVPLANPNHPYNACRAALDHKKKWSELVNKIEELGFVELFHVRTRIGINTGSLVAGNIGSSRRVDYTAIGDNVNLGSRLESINKYYQTDIIISESTFNRVNDRFICRELDYMKVKGKNEPTRIYELIDYKEPDSDKYEWINEFLQGLGSYRKGDWDRAMEIFQTLSQEPINDKVSKIMLDRCNMLKNNPPKDWDGIYKWEVK